MTSNHHAPYDLGYTRATMALNKEKRPCEGERTSKTASQFGLQAATRLHEAGIASNRESACRGEYVESLVIANQHVAVNTFPGLVHTARHTMGVGNARSQ